MATKIFHAAALFALCASTAIATPVAEPAKPLAWTKTTYNKGDSKTKRDDASASFGGAAFLKNPSGEYPLTSISAAFAAPTPEPTTSGGTAVTYAVIGIDVATCGSGWVQAGLELVDYGGYPEVVAYAQWYGAENVFPPNFNPGFGDELVFQIHADTPGTAAIIMQDKTNGQSASMTISAPSSSATLCGADAEWLVTASQGELNNWGTVTYTQAAAYDLHNNEWKPGQGTTNLDIVQNNVQYSSTTTSESSDSVAIQYLGPSS